MYGEFKDAKDAVTSSRDREMLERLHSSDYKFKNKTVWLVWYFNWPEELINEDNDDIGGGGWGLITSKEDMSLSTYRWELRNEWKEGSERYLRWGGGDILSMWKEAFKEAVERSGIEMIGINSW